jgi:hypothetical protein
MTNSFENLSFQQFEELVIDLCRHLFGIGVQSFSEGRDGGRDATFEGKAELYPSKAAPWVGITVIQAKHTNGINRSFSEKDFYSKSSNKTLVGKEIPRIKKLRSEKRLDNYILFANRKLTANLVYFFIVLC